MTVNLTFDVADILGADFDSRRTKVWLQTNIEGDVIIDATGNTIRLGHARATLNADGTGSFTGLPATNGATNPTAFQYQVHVDYPDRDAPNGRASWASGWFSLTATADLADKAAETYVPPTWISTFTADMDAIRDDARDAANDAAASASAAHDISSITVDDDVVEALVKGTAGAGPKTRAALNSSYAREVSLAKYLPLGNTGSGLVAAALANAATEAGAGGTIFIPRYMGTYALDAAVTLDGVNLNGDGATINVTSLGAGVAAITLKATSGTGELAVRGFDLVGPGARSLGTRTASCDGIKVIGNAKPNFYRMRVRQFDNGVNLANDVGHIKFGAGFVTTDNYYGVYVSKNTYDYQFVGCEVNGNTFANLATPADQGIGSLTMRDVHIGFAPYGIYQEPTPAAQGANKMFIQDVILSGARFEAIGNGAIVTDATQGNPTNQSIASDIVIEHPGFSWNATYRIAGRAKDYAVVFSQTDRIIEINVGSYPFTAGDAGTYLVKLAGHDAFILRGKSTQVATTQVTTTSGTANVYALSAPIANGSSPSFAQVDITSGSYLRFSGNNTRFGGDGTLLYSDSSAGQKWRDSANGYATRMELGGTAADATLNLGTSTGYLRPTGSNNRRFGADSTYMYADFNNDLRFRDSANSYALIGRITNAGMVMPKYYIGAAGSNTGPTWTAGTGAPTAAEPNGSHYSRTDGAAGSTFYVRVAGAWVAIA